VKVLITGITGTLGRKLYPYLLETKHEVIGYSRDEQKQRQLPEHESLTLYLGDVRDRDRIIEASRGVDLVFHLAALKCVDTLESNPDESLKTNLLGTDNILHSQRLNKINRVVFTSTDKAAYPINAYGKSKALAEDLVMRDPNNVVCRYGNVLASRGSFLPVIVEHILKGEAVPVTDPRMTRFWMTQDSAAQFVLTRGLSPQSPQLSTPDIKSASVVNVIDTTAKILEKEYDIRTVGIRPGEKLHECLRTSKEGIECMSNDPSFFFSRVALTQTLRPIVEEIACAS